MNLKGSPGEVHDETGIRAEETCMDVLEQIANLFERYPFVRIP